MSDMKAEFLKRENKPDLAYIHHKGQADMPTLMFLGGFRSDMMGSKASFLQQKCEKRGQSYVRFDYSGHGQSGGVFEECCISDWRDDAQDILNHCVNGDAILVGSSMGGWISFLLAQNNPHLVKAIVGIAAAPDFTLWMEDRVSAKQKEDLKKNGFFELPNDYGSPYIITQKLIDDGRRNALLDKGIEATMPVRLLQGKQDADVPWQTAAVIKNALSSADVEIIYREEGNHSLSSPEDLQILDDVILQLI